MCFTSRVPDNVGDQFLAGVATDAEEGDSDARSTREKTAAYLVVRLGSVWYGIAAAQVREMVAPPKPATVPGVPSFIVGVINIVGRIIVLIDTPTLLGVRSSAHVAKQDAEVSRCCIVLQSVKAEVATMVDEVMGLFEIVSSQVKPSGDDQGAAIAAFAHADRLVTVLDVGRLLAQAEARVSGGDGWTS